MTVRAKISDREYVEKHIVEGRNAFGWVQVKFTCADGYVYTSADKIVGRAGRSKLKAHLIELVLAQTNHPIQKVVK